MDCMASNAVAKNGLVLSSRPPQAESWHGHLMWPTECEFDLGVTALIAKNRLDLRSSKDCPWLHCDAEPQSSQPHEPDGVLDQLKAKPLRGGPTGRP
jgi:hypothetical protein